MAAGRLRAGRPRGGWIRVAGAVAAAAVLTAVTAHWVRRYSAPLPSYAILWAAFAAGAWLVLGISRRLAVPLILLGCTAIQLAALSAGPQGSDDLYRYIWDGRVQAAGIDPYGYVPAAPQLTSFRDQLLWPASGPYCVGLTRAAAGPAQPGSAQPGVIQAGSAQGESVQAGGARPGPVERRGLPPGCTRINRPRVHTIYPPVAEAYFTTVAEASPSGAGTLPIQAAGALCALATSVLLVIGLRRLGRDPRFAVLWAWCPVVGLQAGNNAHIDGLAALLTAAALLLLARPGSRRRAIGGGVLLGLAIATKITPILAGPAVLRRRPAAVAVAAASAAGAVYVPHLLAVGSRVIGFLPGYLAQDGYAAGDRFALLSLLVPGKWSTPAAVVVLAAVGVAVLRRTDPDRPWRGALVMTGVALAVTTPTLLWYSMLLVLFVAMDGRPEWLALAGARYLTPLHPLPHHTLPYAAQLGYGGAVLIVAAVTLARWIRRSPDRATLPVEPAGRPELQPASTG
jgi:Glycosyltransferase family 87